MTAEDRGTRHAARHRHDLRRLRHARDQRARGRPRRRRRRRQPRGGEGHGAAVPGPPARRRGAHPRARGRRVRRRHRAGDAESRRHGIGDGRRERRAGAHRRRRRTLRGGGPRRRDGRRRARARDRLHGRSARRPGGRRLPGVGRRGRRLAGRPAGRPGAAQAQGRTQPGCRRGDDGRDAGRAGRGRAPLQDRLPPPRDGDAGAVLGRRPVLRRRVGRPEARRVHDEHADSGRDVGRLLLQRGRHALPRRGPVRGVRSRHLLRDVNGHRRTRARGALRGGEGEAQGVRGDTRADGAPARDGPRRARR